MTTQYVAMRADDTVDQTIEALRALDEDHPTVSYVYVLNEYDKLIGVLSLRTLVLATKNTQLKDIMFDDVITAFPEETEEDVAADISKYDLIAMPVVDENGRMLGIVTVDDAMEVAVVVALLCFLIFLVPYTVIILHFFGGAAG